MASSEVEPRSVVRLMLAVGALAVCLNTIAWGQMDRSGLGPGATVNYRFAAQNEFPITVTLLGPVRNPGRYEISRKIDLINLFALAGGWLETADLSDVHISRSRVIGTQSDRFDIKLDLEDLSNLSQTFVQLQDGDCVYVGTSGGIDLPIILSVVSSTAAVATAIFYITQLNR